MSDFNTTYRPKTWDDVVGQEQVVASLSKVVAERRNRAFCFTGPSGCGKTTLARIIGNEVNAQIIEIDAASNSGVEAMRAITQNLGYSVLGGKKTKLVIVDEAHSLSKQAWQSLLKIVEEPPPHVWWAFCTTEAHKIPKTIKTRCASYELQRVDPDDLFNLLIEVAAAEKLDVDEDIIDLCASKADGSPRQALSFLAAVADCEDRSEAARVLKETSLDDGEVIEFCRLLLKRPAWGKMMKALASLEGQSAEGIRRVVFAYFSKVAQGAKSDDAAAAAVEILEAFSSVYPDDAHGHLLISLANVILVD